MTSKGNVSDCLIIGSCINLSERMLPTYSDVMKCYLHERQIMKLCSNKDPSISEISELVVKKMKDVWINSLIPCGSDKRIKKCFMITIKNTETF